MLCTVHSQRVAHGARILVDPWQKAHGKHGFWRIAMARNISCSHGLNHQSAVIVSVVLPPNS